MPPFLERRCNCFGVRKAAADAGPIVVCASESAHACSLRRRISIMCSGSKLGDSLTASLSQIEKALQHDTAQTAGLQQFWGLRTEA